MAASSSEQQSSSPGRDPVTDLRRIAFLLERSLASPYRVKAFRGAATALLPLKPEEIGAAAADGKLTSLKGVGDKTAAVIEQSLAGEIPDYLSNLEQEAEVPLRPGVRRYELLFAAIAIPIPTGPTGVRLRPKWPGLRRNSGTSTWCSPTTRHA